MSTLVNGKSTVVYRGGSISTFLFFAKFKMKLCWNFAANYFQNLAHCTECQPPLKISPKFCHAQCTSITCQASQIEYCYYKGQVLKVGTALKYILRFSYLRT